MYSNTGIVFQPTDKTVSHQKKLKFYISHSSMSSHVHTRVRSTTLLAIWNLLLVQLCRAKFPQFWLLLQGTVTLWAVPSRVISPIWLRLQGMTRAWMRTEILAEKQATTMSFSLRVCSQELVCLDGRPAIQDVRVSHWRLRLLRKIQVGACGNTTQK